MLRANRRRIAWIVFLAAIGCEDASAPITGPQASPQPTRIHVTRAEFGEAWPLKVAEGDIECISGTLVVFHAKNGKTYALNGAAKAGGYAAIDPIWSDDPRIPGTKKNIWPLIKSGLGLAK